MPCSQEVCLKEVEPHGQCTVQCHPSLLSLLCTRIHLKPRTLIFMSQVQTMQGQDAQTLQLCKSYFKCTAESCRARLIVTTALISAPTAQGGHVTSAKSLLCPTEAPPLTTPRHRQQGDHLDTCLPSEGLQSVPVTRTWRLGLRAAPEPPPHSTSTLCETAPVASPSHP